ncbi:hypothetical protein [Verminephrobacter eiseniae]|uniref:hypothetical protein n=1 Tax=Verminephrobacter eiseniae TaxID=364317 RepID=UPI0022382E04|nr:hypothetical protein [Verminephrobacter eiseniae]MCW5236611.1 hypothetical protein [Verminephrobacter eiseniae]
MYSDIDIREAAKAGLSPKHDVSRDRRLAPEEEAMLIMALDGQELPGKHRALNIDAEAKIFMLLVLNTGLRMN